MKKNLPKLLIREMQLSDIPVVFTIGESVFTAEKVTNLYRTWDEYELLERYLSDKEFCFVAELDKKVVGFVLGAIIEKRKNVWIYGYVYWMAVDPVLKGLGIGQKLLNKLTEIFIDNGVRIMLMDTEASNKTALDFFKKNGFIDPIEHIYLSKNISSHPRYLRNKKKKLAAKK